MADLISRAAAIAEIDEYLHGLDSCISEPDLKLDGYKNGLQVAIQELKALPAVSAVPVVRCKDCKHFEVKDVWANFGSVPILVSDVPTCHRWEGECKTSPDGFCFLGERRESE